MKRNLKSKTSQGFTLIELLLVIAIIGILASAVMVAVSNQRQRAQRSNIVKAMGSAMPYIVECHTKGGTVQVPSTAGNEICNPVIGVSYPPLSEMAAGKVCTTASVAATTNAVTITCTGGNIVCFPETGNCTN